MGRRRPRVRMEHPLDNLRDPMHGRIEDVLVGARGGCVDSGLRAAVLMVPILTPLRSPVETEYRFCNFAAVDRLRPLVFITGQLPMAGHYRK